ncbi:o-methyltransferase [Colletotrichum truncatum]|uniref:O-methyltransferase n=1 Tax=Colletotrichum truncatum TaxID=5467 RepID=A0ACC3Z2Z5_COLTU
MSQQEALIALTEGLLQDARDLVATDAKLVRSRMAMKAKKILQLTAGPDEIIGGLAVAMAEIGALNQYMEWKLFDVIPDKGDISYAKLAESIKGDENLVGKSPRLGGVMVSTGRLVQTSTGHVAHSATSPMFKHKSPPGNLFRVMFDHGLRGYTHWRKYFAKYGNHEPTGVSHNPYTFACGQPELTVWEQADHLDPERAEIFASAMRSAGSIAGKHGGPASIYDFSWLGEEANSSSTQNPLIVDVGGSHGDTLKHILQAVPSIPQSRCVLQDRPDVIDEVIRTDDEGLRDVKKIGHDFMKENPTKDAMVYLLRRVLHNWSDQACVEILTRLRSALPRDEPRARVLIMEHVVSDPPSVRSAATDMIMLNIGGKERTEQGFAKIAKDSGLKIVKVHRLEGTEIGVVECATT